MCPGLAPPQDPPLPLETRQSEAPPTEVAVGVVGGRCSSSEVSAEAGGGGPLWWVGGPANECRSGVRERRGSEVTGQGLICISESLVLGWHGGGHSA